LPDVAGPVTSWRSSTLAQSLPPPAEIASDSKMNEMPIGD
jgi:hypothetical protein